MYMMNTPIKIGQLELKNRLVMPPMATAQSDEKGRVTEQLCAYYDEKTQGGYIGLVIMEHAFVLPEGKANYKQLSIAEDSMVEGLCELTSTIHKNGCQVFAQINHAGGATKKEITGHEVLSSSAIPMPNGRGELPRAMEKEEIEDCIRAFAFAAMRAKKAGFDGVEIHGAHSFLLTQFYSPLVNHRQDEYTGNTLKGRIRLHLQMIEAVREAVGSDYPLAIRFGACDYAKGGSTIADSVEAAKAFEKAGIDLLDISGGFCGYRNPEDSSEGYFAEITEAIKREVKIPVILTGGIVDIFTGERLLEEKKADLIGVGRAMMKDSLWAKKAMESLQ